jgi:cell division protein FtsQ
MGRLFVLNTKGEIFKEMDSADPQNLPIITGLTFSDITVNATPDSGPFKAVMTVLTMGLNHTSIMPNSRIKKIDVDRELGLTLYTSDTWDRIRAVKVGYEEYGEKLEKLKNVLFYLETRNQQLRVDSIDLINLNRIVVTPAAAETPDGNHKEV